MKRKRKTTRARRNPRTYTRAQSKSIRRHARKSLKRLKSSVSKYRKTVARVTMTSRNPKRVGYIIYACENKHGKSIRWYWNGHSLQKSKRGAEVLSNFATAHNVGMRIKGRIMNSSLRNRFWCVGTTDAA